MAGTERTVLQGIQNTSSQSLLPLEVDETSRVLSVDQLKSDDCEASDPSDNHQDDQIDEIVCPLSWAWFWADDQHAPLLKSDDCKASDPSDNQQDEQIDERIRPLARADDQQDYEGGRKSEALSKVPRLGVRGRKEKDERIAVRRVPRYQTPGNPGERCLDIGQSEEFREPVNNARFPLLDEDLIDERGRPLRSDYGGGIRRRLTDNNNQGQTRIASRGLPIPLQMKSNLKQGIQNPSSQSPLHLEVDETPHLSSVNQVRLKPKVSKFDSWESEENCSVYFDNAGKKKNNSRLVINPGDPQDGDPRADPEEQQYEVPRLALDPPALAKSEARSKVVPQFGVWEGEGEAGYNRWWFVNVWMKIKNWVVNRYKSLVNYCLHGERQILTLQSGLDDGNSEFGGSPINYARYPLLDDEDFIAERARSLPMDNGGCRRLIVKKSDNNNVGQTEIASRGFRNPINGSPTSLETESNLIQATSRLVFNNDTPASCHLLTDHRKQQKKIGSWLSWFKRGRKKTTKQG